MKDRKVYQVIKNTTREDIYSYCRKLSYASIILGILSISAWVYVEFSDVISFLLWKLFEIFTSGFIHAGSFLIGVGILFLLLGDFIAPPDED